MSYFRWIPGLLLLLVACTPQAVPIPTLMQLPTGIPTAEATITVQSVFDSLPPTFTPTFTFTPTTTPTGTLAPTGIPTITLFPSATITDTPTATGTPPPPLPTIDPQNRPFLAFVLTEAANATVLPADYIVPPFQGINVTVIPETALPDGAPSGIPPLEAITITPDPNNPSTTLCPINPTGGFGGVFSSNTAIQTQIGCPTGTVQDVPAAWQTFQQGVMVWLNGEMLVLYNSGQFQSLPDTFVEGVDPQNSSETPPQGLFTPIRGFLKVWSSNPSVRNGLGWAMNQEQGVTAKAQTFASGRMIWLPGRGDIFVLQPNNRWQGFAGSY